MSVRRWLVAGVLFGVLWVFVSGASLTPLSLLTHFLVGTAVGIPIAYVFRRLYEDQLELGQFLRGIPYLFLYVGVFSKAIIVANVDVTYRVLAPEPLEPQVILVPLRVETDVGITTIANSITITPGTVTLDYEPDRNALYVHGIDGRHPQEMVEPIRQWEDIALQIFDEENSPSDPPPEITVHPPDYPPEPKIGELEPIGEQQQGEDGAGTTAQEVSDDER